VIPAPSAHAEAYELAQRVRILQNKITTELKEAI